MIAQPFSKWHEDYSAFKNALEPVLTKELPSEPSELARENQTLPTVLKAANSHKALAAMYFQQYRELKQSMVQVTWARDDARGLADVVKARMIAVSVAMRPQD